MLKQRFLTGLIAAALALALGYGLFRLFAIRWERGDVYPEYSSQRADPIGTRALFDSLEALPQFNVQRNYRPLQKLRPKEPVTLVYAAAPRGGQWGSEELRHFETLIASGSRAVFAFAAADLLPEIKNKKDTTEKPADAQEKKTEADSDPKPEKTQEDDKKPTSEEENGKSTKRPSFIGFSEVAERWGFDFEVATGRRTGSFHGIAKVEGDYPGLESTLSWHSALRFVDLQPAWKVLYRAAGEPVVIERRWGDGTIVLAADTFFLSNEALLKERSPGFLAWLIGAPRTVIFDEEHLGVTEDTGLVALARKYNLQGAIAALALVALLWIWRQSMRLVPVHETAKRVDEYVAGLDSHAGFVSLLRRTVPPARVLDLCVQEWRKTFGHNKKTLAIAEQAFADAIPDNVRKYNPVDAYQAIVRALNQKKTR